MEMYVPQILIPKFYANEKDPVSANIGMFGEYEFIKKRSGIITQHLKFRNVITDVGLKHFAQTGGALADQITHLYLGTGTTSPTSSDTILESWSNQGNCDSVTSYSYDGGFDPTKSDWMDTIQWDYDLNHGIGNWTECGVGWTNNPSVSPSLFSRSLIKDNSGNPITCEKTINDTLTIIYKIHIKRASDTPFSNIVNLSGIGDITVLSLVPNVGLSWLASNWYGGGSLFDSSRVGNGLGNGSNIPDATLSNGIHSEICSSAQLYQIAKYVDNTMYRDITVEFPATVTGVITEAVSSFIGQWQANGIRSVSFGFNPGIVLDGTKKLRIGFRVSLGRITT